jgi:starvation-inducible DNA-binding protein
MATKKTQVTKNSPRSFLLKMKESSMKSATLDQNICEDIAQTLAYILSDTYVLYTKTQNFHWNLIDPRFFSLHVLFEMQYQELAEALDDIAERIRMLGIKAPASMQEFLEMTSLRESNDDLTGDEMLEQLLQDHEDVANNIRPNITQIQKLGDEGTADLLIHRLRKHEKIAWILRSHLQIGQ